MSSRWLVPEPSKQQLQVGLVQPQEAQEQEVNQAMQPLSEAELPLVTPQLASGDDLLTPETCQCFHGFC